MSKPKVETHVIPKKRSIIDITRDLVLARNEYEIFNEEDLMDRVTELFVELRHKEDGIYFFYKQMDGEITLFDDQIKKMKKHIEMMKKAQERTKMLVLECYSESGEIPKHSEFNPVRIGQSSGKVIIEDEDMIPQEYFKETTTWVLDRKRISEELKLGAQINGVRLEKNHFVKGLK